MKKIIITLFMGLFVAVMGTKAQEAVSTAGGETSGSTGTASYTIGQVFYTTHDVINGSVEQGVQQPYEISTTVGINETTINLELSIYPNPTANYLTLQVEKPQGLTYQLYDLRGKVIERKVVKNTSTIISLEGQPTATYFLKVVKNNQVIKMFKIIKN